MKTKLPLHWTERIRQILFLVSYVALFEYTYPTPFIQSRWGQVIYLAILFYIIKGVVRYKQEQSARFVRKTERVQRKWERRKLHFSDYTRHRIARIVRFAIILFTVGWLIDGATTKCTGAIACGAALPGLIATNFQSILMFTINFAIGMSGLFGTMWFLARMDLYNLILPDSIMTRFSDVYGQDKAVQSVREALTILDKPEEIEALGGYMPGGILLSGPPGVGKSYLAEAAAGEAGKPFVSVDGSSFSSMWMGVPIMKVKMIYKHLRKLSVKHGGVVMFFDEIDILGSRGMGVVNQMLARLFLNDAEKAIVTGGGGGNGTLQIMLTEMSGMKKPKGLYNKIRVLLGFKPIPPPDYRILTLAATNMVESLDPALLRPGRFDRKIHMGYPNVAGRTETFRGYLNRLKTHELTEEQIERLARENPNATGASIKDAVNEGLLKAVREGRTSPTFEDIRDVILAKMMGETEGEMETEEDRWRTAVHEAAHAVMSHYVRPEAPIQFASVAKRGKTGGFVRAVDEVDGYYTRSRLIADIMVCQASLWAEKYYFDDDVSVGPQSDLRKAKALAMDGWAKYAMGDWVMVYDDDEITAEMREEVHDWLNAIYENTHDFMMAHRDQVELVAQMLQSAVTIDGEEIHELLEKTS